MAAEYPSRVDITPWSDWTVVAGTPARNNDSADLDMARLGGSLCAQSWKVLLKEGAWTFGLVHTKQNACGIHTVKLNGVTIGSIDAYTGSLIRNAYGSIAGVIVPTRGVYTLEISTLTQNASANGSYLQYLHHITLIRTADLPLMAYHEDWPGWSAADVVSPGSLGRLPTSAELGGGYGYQAGTLNALYSYQADVAAGTYTLTVVERRDANTAIATVTIDGSVIGTWDGYSAAQTHNNVTTFSGIALTAGNHMIQFQALSKNASAGGYYLGIQWLSLDRTGA